LNNINNNKNMIILMIYRTVPPDVWKLLIIALLVSSFPFA